MAEVGAWNSFQVLEELLTLDELMLLNEAVGKKTKDTLKMQLMIAGVDVSDWDEEEDANDSDLPPELIEAERALAKKNANKGQDQEFAELGFGYARA